MTGLPLIGWAKPVPVDTRHLKHPKRDFALIAAAGPASNVLLALLGAAIYAVLPTPAPGDIAGRVVMNTPREMFLWFTYINVALAVFNMIPVPPLDGGNVLVGVLPHAGARLVEQVRPYGVLVLYALMLTGVLDNVLGPIPVGVTRFLLGMP